MSTQPQNQTSSVAGDSREVIRCDHCHLVQFRTGNNLCRKCRKSFDGEERCADGGDASASARVVADQESDRPNGLDVGAAVRILRQAHGLSQRDVANGMGVPRTYISKIERHHASPNVESIYRLAGAIGVPAFVIIEFATMLREAALEHRAA
ncbi:MAG TPA: helix-turn-helix transcriptional regulator [Candidatus Angelobacter sp.]|nr:helix-turn-helix transcriptional regulator [Candidatus Angelobacter sp.]